MEPQFTNAICSTYRSISDDSDDDKLEHDGTCTLALLIKTEEFWPEETCVEYCMLYYY